MVRIGEDRSSRLDVTPAQYRVIETVRPRYACPKGCAGVAQAPAPAHLIEGGIPTEALLARVAVAKFSEHMPLYRQSQVFARHGIMLDRAVLADWMGTTAFHLAPIVERMSALMKLSGRLFMDGKRTPGAVHSVGLKFQGMSASMFLLDHRSAIRSRVCWAQA
ncbi:MULTISPECIES: IS66 family transposase [Methylosinus]|uniref:IS66 family transposase n=1 Tax=Methylosinus TaxID=425 RepID=UPI0001D2D70E|nr:MULTISPECIES: transposase [Methylosinus]